jgi:hypothetical protein
LNAGSNLSGVEFIQDCDVLDEHQKSLRIARLHVCIGILAANEKSAIGGAVAAKYRK